MDEVNYCFEFEKDEIVVQLERTTDVSDFLKAHVEFYAELDANMLHPNKVPEKSVILFLRRLPVLERWAKTVNKNPDLDTLTARDITTALTELPPYSSAMAVVIRDIWVQLGPSSGAAAIAAYNGISYHLNPSEKETARGMIAFYLADAGVSSKTPFYIKTALEQIQKDYTNTKYENRKQVDSFFDQLKTEIKQAGTAKENIAHWWIQREQELIASTSKKLEDRIKKFDGMQKTYEETMRLHRPRAYWSKKAKGHEKRGEIIGVTALIWLLAAGVVSIAGIWCLVQEAVRLSIEASTNKQTLPTGVLASLGAMGLVGTSTLFWIGRLAVRLWLSELHLGMDARERVTMIESYLALSKTGAVEEKQRDLVLAAIFRPTQDGIVKDDSSADPTLIGVLSRLTK